MLLKINLLLLFGAVLWQSALLLAARLPDSAVLRKHVQRRDTSPFNPGEHEKPRITSLRLC